MLKSSRDHTSMRLCAHVILTSICLATLGQTCQAVELYVGTMKANKILFLGNSLTYHAYSKAVGWTGDWGMAATAQSKDYAHLVTSSIARLNGNVSPAITAVNIVSYGAFEQKYTNYDAATELKALVDWAPNIVVVELGDNVSASLTTQTAIDAYASSYADVLSVLKNSSEKPAIFATSTWWKSDTTDEIMKTACTSAGGVFINIGGLFANTANQGGWGGHPNDAGMQAIADTVFSDLQAKGAPEPSSLVSLASAVVFVAGLGWMRNTFNFLSFLFQSFFFREML